MQRKTPSIHLNNYMDKNSEENITPKTKKVKKVSDKNKKSDNLNAQNAENIDPNIARVLKEALMIQIVNERQKKREEINELDAMVSTCQEFMSCFIILGYDLSRQPINPIVFAHNQQEADALGSYMSKFIHHNIKEIDPSSE
jgi:hypothetical protein